MKFSFAATTFFSLSASVTANNILPTNETPNASDATTNKIMEAAMAGGNSELLDHLNAFSTMKEGALIEGRRRRLQDADDADEHQLAWAELSKRSNDQHQVAWAELSKPSKCFYGFATEAFKHYGNGRGKTYTSVESERYPSGRIYFWGTNAVCDDESTNAITFLPKTPYAGDDITEPSYCAEGSSWADNAPLIGSATGHCFISPVRIDEKNFGGDASKCNIGEDSACAWACQEVMIINNEYIFMQYNFQPDTDGTFPKVFDAVVTGGTGCYNVKTPTIIKAYTAFNSQYYVYDLMGIKSSKSGKGGKDRNSLIRRHLKTAKATRAV